MVLHIAFFLACTCERRIALAPESHACSVQGAKGAQLLEIIRAIPKLQSLMRIDQVEDTIVPMLMQALDTGDTHLQEEVRSSTL
jgi:hypothetical protein